MIAAIVLGCYAAAWLAAARLLYGRWRGGCARPRYCDIHGQARTSGKRPGCCLDDAGWVDAYAATFGMLAALAWPAVLLVAAVRFRPPPTAAEQAAEEKKLKARIAELEREAGITPRT